MIRIDVNNPKSIYEQVYDEFVKLIVAKVLKPDEKLPSVRELASIIRINPNTIQKSYKLLETNNYIYSVKGKGNFVNNNEELLVSYTNNIMDKIKENIILLKKMDMDNEKILSFINAILKGVDANVEGKRA